MLAISWGAIFIRLAGEAPPLVIAAYRLSIASLAIVPATLTLSAPSTLRFTRQQLLLAGLSSLFLTVHFASWVASLRYTSVASSVVLVTTTPLVVALASRLFLKERLERRVLLGIGLGLVGSLVIGSGDFGLGTAESLLGDALALVGALAAAGYFLVGRRLRPQLPVMPYISLVYTGTALLLLAGAAASGDGLWGYSGKTWLWLVLAALVPQVIGHSLLNWALARVTATLVATSTMAEPVIATLLALLILDETPPATSLVGGAIILTGIYLALWRR